MSSVVPVSGSQSADAGGHAQQEMGNEIIKAGKCSWRDLIHQRRSLARSEQKIYYVLHLYTLNL